MRAAPYYKFHKIKKVLLESVQNAAQKSMNAAVNGEENGSMDQGSFKYVKKVSCQLQNFNIIFLGADFFHTINN